MCRYIGFAYKLSDYQAKILRSEGPKWVDLDRFNIQARAPAGNPTKDQSRLTMQALLVERFKLVTH